jgi:hypothetical protein
MYNPAYFRDMYVRYIKTHITIRTIHNDNLDYVHAACNPFAAGVPTGTGSPGCAVPGGVRI